LFEICNFISHVFERLIFCLYKFIAISFDILKTLSLMDSDQRIEALEEHVNDFLETREGAFQLLHHIRQIVKDHYPDDELTQEERAQERTTNQVEGNIWAKMRVHLFYTELTFQEIAGEMNSEANLVLNQINLAASEGIRLLHVRRTIELLQFLRKSDATQLCLERIDHLRKYVPFELFKPSVTNPRDEAQNCILMYCFLDAAADLKLIRRLNFLRLKEALDRLDPDEKRAKVNGFFQI
jgi:hypothetical protein